MRGTLVAPALLLLAMVPLFCGFGSACGGTASNDAARAGDGGGSSGVGSSSGLGSSGSGSSGGASGSGSGGSSSGTQCTGLECEIDIGCGASVNAGRNTSISGVVYDPAGNNPLPNVVVYVPNGAVQSLPSAPTDECSCGSLFTGDPIAVGVTDATGHFTIPNAPDNESDPGTPVPLVVQLGKWRKQTSIATVTACTDNGGGIQKLTLPSRADANDDLPEIAISTGGNDTLECTLQRVGLSPTEYTRGAGGTGHVHVFQGSSPAFAELQRYAAIMSPDGGATPSANTSLFDTLGHLSPYDVVLLPCEGAEPLGQPDGGPLSSDELNALVSYTAAGGRALISHMQYPWLASGPFAAANPPPAEWVPGTNVIFEGPNPSLNAVDEFTRANTVTTLAGGGAFQKGATFQSWLGTVGAVADAGLLLRHTGYNAIVGPSNTPSQPWLVADANATASMLDGGFLSVPGAELYYAFNTPIGGAGTDDAGAPQYCGRVIYSELHVESTEYGETQPIVPDDCDLGTLSTQEMALEYMLFDLTGCVTPDSGPGSGAWVPPLHP